MQVVGKSLLVSFVFMVNLLLLNISCRSTERAQVMPAFVEGHRLFEAHCAACHGSNGLGDGPAAIGLKIKPRDFRNEPFRYVSVLEGGPTQEDLIQTIKSGRRYGDMPANRVLTDKEILALVDYVREINRLGLIERITQDAAEEGEEMDSDEIDEIASEMTIAGEPITVSWPGPDFQSDTQIGHTLYMDRCASCHGPTGLGDGLDLPLDEQGKPIKVRDLTSGEFRGGVTLEEVYKRNLCGVPGTPMPVQEGLSDEDVWQLVYYVRFLAGKSR
jgi:mono/diheme cytochrome c family protein